MEAIDEGEGQFDVAAAAEAVSEARAETRRALQQW